MELSPVSYIDDLEAIDTLSRQNTRPADSTVDFKADGKDFVAIVKSTDGRIEKYVRPLIELPDVEINVVQNELTKFSEARNRKDTELKILREQEKYSAIETASQFRREYENKVIRLTAKLDALKAQAPGKIQKSIDEIKKFVALLDAEKSDCESMIADAEKLKGQYGV